MVHTTHGPLDSHVTSNMFRSSLYERKGFTLIELLVVIAIIGLLTSVVMISMTTVRSKSRDTRRMRDLQEIQKALALYVTNTGNYPVSPAATVLSGSDMVTDALVDSEALSGVISGDPQHPTRAYTYVTNNSGTTYTITFCLETDTIPNYTPGCSNTVAP